MAEEYKRKTSADVDDAQLKSISIGDEVEIVTRGRVCELRDGYSYDVMPCGCMTSASEDKKSKRKAEKKKYPASITVEVISTRVESENEYEKMAKDEEKD